MGKHEAAGRPGLGSTRHQIANTATLSSAELQERVSGCQPWPRIRFLSAYAARGPVCRARDRGAPCASSNERSGAGSREPKRPRGTSSDLAAVLCSSGPTGSYARQEAAVKGLRSRGSSGLPRFFSLHVVGRHGDMHEFGHVKGSQQRPDHPGNKAPGLVVDHLRP